MNIVKYLIIVLTICLLICTAAYSDVTPPETVSTIWEGTANTPWHIGFAWADATGQIPNFRYSEDVYYKLEVWWVIGNYEVLVGIHNISEIAGTSEYNIYDGSLLRSYDLFISAGFHLCDLGTPAVDAVVPPGSIYTPELSASAGNRRLFRIRIKYRTSATTEASLLVASMYVHDSHDATNTGNHNIYGGTISDCDYLFGYVEYPEPISLDPLSTWRYNQIVPDDQNNPDDGTTSSTYTFRVKYYNFDDLPPLNYIRSSYYGSLQIASEGEPDTSLYVYVPSYEPKTGVVLYLKKKDETYEDNRVYMAIPMHPEPYVAIPPADYYRNGVVYRCDLTTEMKNYFTSLPVGEYEYFFGCTDDNVLYLDLYEEIPFLAPDPNEPHNYRYDGYFDTQYTRGNCYSLDSFIDRVSYMPGIRNIFDWEINPYTHLPTPTYMYPCTEHPVVSLGLRAVVDIDNPLNPYNFNVLRPCQGSVLPYYRMVSPLTGEITSGATVNDPVDFFVIYQQLYGIAPDEEVGGEIRVWIDNTSDGTGTYKSYNLVRTDDYGTDITKGVLFRLPTPITLPAGPHTYYFTASDGTKTARFPVRNSKGSDWFMVQGISRIEGPYINNAPVLSNASVSPTSGRSGQSFRYTVTYTDADNQRPYQPHVIVQWQEGGTLANGGAERLTMVKLDPTDTNYANGCIYYFDSANLMHRLQPGMRHFYFEFIDDWGSLNDPNDRVQGQMVRLGKSLSYTWAPDWIPDWIDGPSINSNQKPLLKNGSVSSPDGTSNGATNWTWRVSYTDMDNDSPGFVLVYIGQVQEDGSIIWDAGHTMLASDPNDNVYTDGREYAYTSTLEGGDPAIDYAYAFIASDGVDMTQYDPVTSPSSNAIWDPKETLTPIDSPINTQFATSMTPIVGVVPVPPYNPLIGTDYFYRYPKVYDSLGNELTYGVSADYTVDFDDGVITLASPLDSIDVQYWFATAGPTDVIQNTPPYLESGGVTPTSGESTTNFKYFVIYRDVDGGNGQAPWYVKVVIDGVAHDMTTATAHGVYKDGVRYEYTTTLTSGTHTYYFETSDGSGYAVLDSSGLRNGNSPITNIVGIEGPYVNDVPTLLNGYIDPNPGEGIYNTQAVYYSITYKDNDNDQVNSGYPYLYVDNADETEHSGTVTAVTATTMTDNTQDWETGEFEGIPVQITSGPCYGQVYRIVSNTSDTLTLQAEDITDPALGGPINVGNTFSISKIRLFKQDAQDQDATNGITYEINVPSLGVGDHTAHFKSVTTETYAPSTTRDSVARYPTSGEMSGPLVIETPAPEGTEAPVLSDHTLDITPVNIFDFSVKYSDVMGFPPAFHDNVLGYMRLVIETSTDVWETFDMTPPASPNYVIGAVFTHTLTTLSPGEHQYHYVASNGYLTTRYPASPSEEFIASVNRAPVLSNDSVNPVAGNEGTNFTYSVTYTDADNEAPTNVYLMIDANPAINITASASGTDYKNGVVYSYQTTGGSLGSGTHSFYFEASDGEESTTTTVQNLPNIHDNTSPTLSTGTVLPTSGYSDDNYVYTITYTDTDGDPPSYVKVYIDGTAEANAYTMTSNGSTSYSTGVAYSYTKVGLTAGDHTFMFKASDGLAVVTDPSSGSHTGPSVTQRPLADITIAHSASPTVGEPVTLSGTITPAMSVDLTIVLTKPDSSTQNIIVTSATNGTYSYTWTPSIIGGWKAQTTWAGDSTYGASESDEIDVDVAGPTKTVNGLAFISVPLWPSPSDPAGTFGATPVFALAKYYSSINGYYFFTLLPNPPYDIVTNPEFPTSIVPGQGFWIKTLEPKTLAPSGSLVSTSSDYRITLAARWNMIGNPFTDEITWGNIRVTYGAQTVSLATAAANGWIRDYGWVYNTSTGSYRLVSATEPDADRTLQPWDGCWVYSRVNGCQLVITPPTTLSRDAGSYTRSVSTDAFADNDSLGWSVKLSASNGAMTDESNYIGVRSGKPIAMHSPSLMGDYVDLYITDKNDAKYARELRSAANSGDEWLVNVETDHSGMVTIAWEGMDNLPEGASLVLVDVEKDKEVVMQQGEVYSFEAAKGAMKRSFKIRYEQN